MKSLLEQVEGVDNLLRQLMKTESKMKAGQFIGAYREICRLIALLERSKMELLEGKKSDDE